MGHVKTCISGRVDIGYLATCLTFVALTGCSQQLPEDSILGAMIAKSEAGNVLIEMDEYSTSECRYSSQWNGTVQTTCRSVNTLPDGSTAFTEYEEAAPVSGANDQLCTTGDDTIKLAREALENGIIVRNGDVLPRHEEDRVVAEFLAAVVAALRLKPDSQVCGVYFGLSADGLRSDLTVNGLAATGMESSGVWLRRQDSYHWREDAIFPPRNAEEATRYIESLNSSPDGPAE